ncbi:hypothetical protein GW17_00029112 [Ensete ventricosum]|nr:hypothetical protein GW17_00029112 [Ensete ventricosum]
MGLIAHNRIYVCIGVFPCHVIVNPVIIGSVDHRITMHRDIPLWHRGSRCNLHAPAATLHRGRIILFSKGCPSPLLAPLYAAVVIAPAQAAGLAVGGRPLQAQRGQEIVYSYIPDPDGEDDGGQASSSLAVSTRWISAAKLLQSDLATLAQRERGE